MNALLILNGDIKYLRELKSLKGQFDFILCADGGADYCLRAALVPDLIIGDLDSISVTTLNKIREYNIPIDVFPTKKDKTDAELSIDYLIRKGFKDITLIGALGNRVDHALANILLLNKLSENEINGKILDGNNVIYLVNEELALDKEEDSFLSIIPITHTGIVLTLKGFEYELENANIEFGSTIGISNRIVSQKGYIRLCKGKCLAIISKD